MKDDVDAINAENDTEIEELRKTIKGLSALIVEVIVKKKIANRKYYEARFLISYEEACFHIQNNYYNMFNFIFRLDDERVEVTSRTKRY